jgi:glycosyltransferase involved in cell wall biosynthesis
MRLFNNEDTIDRALESLWKQDWGGDITAIIGLDADSRDDTRRLVRAFTSARSRENFHWMLVPHPHVNLLGSTKLLLSKVTQDAIMFLDGDNRYYPNRIRDHMQKYPLGSHPGICGLCSKIMGEGGGFAPLLSATRSYTGDELVKENVVDIGSVRIEGRYMRTRLLPLLRDIPEDSDLVEDYLMFMIAAEDGLLHIHPDVVTEYWIHPFMLSRRTDLVGRTTEAQNWFRKIRPTLTLKHYGLGTVFHPYVPGPKYLERTTATWKLLADPWFREKEWGMFHYPCVGDHGYEDGLTKLWGKGTMVIVEQDILFRRQMIQDLAECPELLCAQDFSCVSLPCHYAEVALHSGEKARTCLPHGLPECFPVHRTMRVWDDKEHTKGRWIREDEKWCDFAGFGLTKISQKLQQKVELDLAPGDWTNLDTRFSLFMSRQGYRFHVHRPRAINCKPNPVDHIGTEGLPFVDVCDLTEEERLSLMPQVEALKGTYTIDEQDADVVVQRALQQERQARI